MQIPNAAISGVPGQPGIAAKIEEAYPQSSFSSAQLCYPYNPKKTSYYRPSYWGSDWAQEWCTEGQQIAENITFPYDPAFYPTMDNTSGTTDMNKYMQIWTPIAEQRIALAGCRLAVMLNFLLDPAHPLPC